jgi:hypothetical protein
MFLYLAYAVSMAVLGKSFTGMLGLLALFIDTVFFLIMASYGAERVHWLASAFYLFLLGEALAFYSTVEVVVVVAVSAVFCAVLPYGAAPLERTVIVSGVVACAFAVTKRQLTLDAERLREKLSEAEKAADKASESFSRWPAAELYQPANAPRNPAQSHGSRPQCRHVRPQTTASPRPIPGPRLAHLPALHAASGCRRRKPGGNGAPRG